MPSRMFLRRSRPAGAWAFLGMLLALAGCASSEPPHAACASKAPELACVAEGAVRGERLGEVVAFRGIPYAQPPLGALRWQAPQAPRPWRGVRDATRYGAVCPQLNNGQVEGDEDCLTVNVWRPAQRPSGPLPVMVFFPGGGNHSFSGQGAPVFGGVSYRGEQLAREGAILVTFNYRLGALGFLAHAGDAPTGQRIVGNYGALDQLALLRWVQRNAAAFDGDARRVFLFGTSAGGGNLCALLAAPSARGLFHGVAMQSSVPTGCELPALAEAQASTGARVAQALGCAGPDAAACLRRKTTAEITAAVPGTFGLFPRLYGPVVDGALLTEQPLATLRRGAHAAVPVIVGNTTQETMQFVNSVGSVTDATSYAAAVARVFGEAEAGRIVQRYPASAYATPRDALVQLTTDGLFTCQTRKVARALAVAQTAPVYTYLFDHVLGNDAQQRALGAVHTLEHVFFFPWQGAYRPDARDLAVQGLMVGHWTHLAKHATLAGSPAGDWAPTTSGDAPLRIGAASGPTPANATAACDFWDSVRLPWPHL